MSQDAVCHKLHSVLHGSVMILSFFSSTALVYTGVPKICPRVVQTLCLNNNLKNQFPNMMCLVHMTTWDCTFFFFSAFMSNHFPFTLLTSHLMLTYFVICLFQGVVIFLLPLMRVKINFTSSSEKNHICCLLVSLL